VPSEDTYQETSLGDVQAGQAHQILHHVGEDLAGPSAADENGGLCALDLFWLARFEGSF